MKALATFVGTVSDFRTWLAAGMPKPENVVSLAEYRQKKKAAKKAASRKPFKPSIA